MQYMVLLLLFKVIDHYLLFIFNHITHDYLFIKKLATEHAKIWTKIQFGHDIIAHLASGDYDENHP